MVDKPLEIGGTIFEYDNQKHLGRSFEKLVAKGPTNEELIIALLFQRGSQVHCDSIAENLLAVSRSI